MAKKKSQNGSLYIWRNEPVCAAIRRWKWRCCPPNHTPMCWGQQTWQYPSSQQKSDKNMMQPLCEKGFGGRGEGGVRTQGGRPHSGHKALHTCTSWYAYAAMFGSSQNEISTSIWYDTQPICFSTLAHFGGLNQASLNCFVPERPCPQHRGALFLYNGIAISTPKQLINTVWTYGTAGSPCGLPKTCNSSTALVQMQSSAAPQWHFLQFSIPASCSATW